MMGFDRCRPLCSFGCWEQARRESARRGLRRKDGGIVNGMCRPLTVDRSDDRLVQGIRSRVFRDIARCAGLFEHMLNLIRLMDR